MSTARQLAGLALLVKQGNSFAGKTVRLGNDISLSNDDNTFNRSVRWWDGIGSVGKAFSGTFDGCGHTISEMTAVGEGSDLALFVNTDGATIRDLTVRGEVSARGGAAALISHARRTTVRDCVCDAAVCASDQLAGGIVAAADDGCALERCVNHGVVSGTTGVGGIVGSVADGASSLTDCLNYGAVSGDGASGGLGGIAGKIGGAVTRCANYGAVSGSNWYVGGVVGCANLLNASVLTDCCNAGAVQNTHSYPKAATGGVVGYGNYYSLTNGFCYAAVSGIAGTVGGVVGLDSRRSTNHLENTACLDSGCAAAVGGVAEPTGAKLLSAAGFASTAYLDELNVNGCFELRNGSYPELIPASVCPGSRFADMPPEGHWAHTAIDWAIVNSVTAGTSAATFSPDAGCTRSQVVTFLWRAAGQPEPASTQDPFRDVREDAFCYKAVLWAAENGITAGTSAETFSPDDICTRGQIVTFLWRFAGEPVTESAAQPFSDVATGAYYEKAVIWASKSGVTAGISPTRFDPGAACTRAQVVTFLYRMQVDQTENDRS